MDKSRFRSFLRRVREQLRRRTLLSVGVALGATAVIVGLVTSPAIVGASAVQRKLPVYSVERDGKTAALTFDAAWGNEDTQALIDVLARYGVKATFFVTGGWAEKFPESVQALSQAGHPVMNHSYVHAHFSKLTPEQIIGNVNRCSDLVEELTGLRPTLFRCPYGEYDDLVIATLEGMGVTAVQWNVDSLDWKGISAAEIQKRVLNKTVPGSIILFHNAAQHTPEALPGIIEGLLAEGYTLVTVQELLLPGETTIDHTGRQFPA